MTTDQQLDVLPARIADRVITHLAVRLSVMENPAMSLGRMLSAKQLALALNVSSDTSTPTPTNSAPHA